MQTGCKVSDTAWDEKQKTSPMKARFNKGKTDFFCINLIVMILWLTCFSP